MKKDVPFSAEAGLDFICLGQTCRAFEQEFLHLEKSSGAQMLKGAEMTHPGQLTSFSLSSERI